MFSKIKKKQNELNIQNEFNENTIIWNLETTINKGIIVADSVPLLMIFVSCCLWEDTNCAKDSDILLSMIWKTIASVCGCVSECVWRDGGGCVYVCVSVCVSVWVCVCECVCEWVSECVCVCVLGMEEVEMFRLGMIVRGYKQYVR